MRKFIIILTLFSIAFVFSGCLGFKGRIPIEERVFSLSASDKEALIIVGFIPLEDNRPQTDISYMTSVKEKVSDKILNTLKEIRLFDEIHFPAAESDNIVISGEVRKFNWKSFDTMISYIPGLNVLPFFGLPSTRVHTEIDIHLELKDRKTNKVILGFNESYLKRRKYNIYNFKPDKAEKELAYCFDIVLKRIKKRIILNKNKILEVVKPETIEVSKPEEEVEIEEVLEVIDSEKEDIKETE